MKGSGPVAPPRLIASRGQIFEAGVPPFPTARWDSPSGRCRVVPVRPLGALSPSTLGLSVPEQPSEPGSRLGKRRGGAGLRDWSWGAEGPGQGPAACGGGGGVW